MILVKQLKGTKIEMSISVYGKIKEKRLDNDLFKRSITDFFLSYGRTKLKYNDGVFYYEGKDFAFDIYFIEDKEPPFNVWDSVILGDEFEYAQTIMFDLYKEIDRVEEIDYEGAYRSIIEFFIFLNKKIESTILVTSDPHNDICYIDKDIRWSESWLNRYEER